MSNIKYIISKNFYNSNDTLEDKDGGYFVGCGAESGAILGQVYSVSGDLSISSDTVISPFIVFCTTKVHANNMFKNLKNDKGRFNRLAAEIQKKKIIDKVEKQRIFDSIREEMDSEVKPLEESQSSMDKGKRLALNNGIYTPNDSIYNS